MSPDMFKKAKSMPRSASRRSPLSLILMDDHSVGAPVRSNQNDRVPGAPNRSLPTGNRREKFAALKSTLATENGCPCWQVS